MLPDEQLALTRYLMALRRSLPYLLIFGAVGGVLAFAIANTFKPVHEAHFSYLVSLSEREEASEYRFDGFYALQATDLFAATLARWVTTPEVIAAAHEAAGLQVTSEDPRSLTRLIQAEKAAPQLVAVTVRADDPLFAAALLGGLQAVMDDNIDEYHDQGIPALRFRVTTTETWQGKIEVARGVIAAATAVLIVFLGANGVLLAETFREQSSSRIHE